MVAVGTRQFLLPQEVETFVLLPAIRKELARAMAKQGMDQKEVARRMGITPAAVSQYIHNKRVRKLSFTKELLSGIQAAATRIHEPIDTVREMQQLLNHTSRNKFICQIHEQLGGVPAGCRICFE